MGANYELADESVHMLARQVLEEHHPELKMPDGSHVRLCLMMASGDDGESDEAPVKCHGYPCAAVVSVIPYKQRVDKRADAEIIIDQKQWNNLTEPQQLALLDHEIQHLEIQTDENGFVKTDDSGRPKLKLKLHEWNIGGFRAIAERYGSDAPEVIEARKFQERFGDVVLNEDAKLFA